MHCVTLPDTQLHTKENIMFCIDNNHLYRSAFFLSFQSDYAVQWALQMVLYAVFCIQHAVIILQIRELHQLSNICTIKSNMYEFRTVLISSQTKIYMWMSLTVLCSHSYITEDYSSLKLETCEALMLENHHFWAEPFFSFRCLLNKYFTTHIINQLGITQFKNAYENIWSISLNVTDTWHRNLKHKDTIVSIPLCTGESKPLAHSWEMQKLQIFFFAWSSAW